MALPEITAYPGTPPNPFTQNRDDFNNNMLQWVPWTASLPDEINEFSVAVEALGVEVEANKDLTDGYATAAAGSASDADSSASLAAASANLGGTWTALGTDSVTAFEAMYLHNDIIYIPIVNLADASTVEPGTDGGATWYDYTSSVSAGDVVSSPTDITGSKLTNVSWLVSRGIGEGYDASARTFTNPSDLIDLGLISGLCDGSTLGISGLTGSNLGTLTIQGSGDDAAVANAVSLSFIYEGATYTRSSVNATTWGDWFTTGGNVTDSAYTMSTQRLLGRNTSGTGDIEEIDATTGRAILSAAKSGAIGSSELTMSSSRFLARSSSGTGSVEQLTASSARELMGVTRGSGSVTVGVGYSDMEYEYTKIDDMIFMQLTFTADNTIPSSVTSFSNPLSASLDPAGVAGGLACAVTASDGKIAVSMDSTWISLDPIDVPGGSRDFGVSLIYKV